jgi:hypothetical protein
LKIEFLGLLECPIQWLSTVVLKIEFLGLLDCPYQWPELLQGFLKKR